MVKADLGRDYYGDLELQPGADAQDIKKQFKKLGIASEINIVCTLLTLARSSYLPSRS